MASAERRSTVDAHRTAIRSVGTKDQADQFTAPCANQAGKAKHFAAMQCEIHTPDARRTFQILEAQDHIAAAL